MRNITGALASLALALSLAACGGTGAPQPGPGAGTQPVQPTAPFIPEAGAAVGSGDGSVIGTVRVSPNATEIELMGLVNEIRTKGTLNGKNVIPGTCVEETFKPGTLRPLTFNGMLAYAARMHAVYLGEVGYDTENAHEQRRTEAPQFYGVTIKDRINRSYGAYAPGLTFRAVGENVAGGYPSTQAVMTAWINSEGHCKNLMDPRFTSMGMGYYPRDTTDLVDGRRRHLHSWTQLFSF